MVICIDDIICYDLWRQVYIYYEKILKPAYQTDYDDRILFDEAFNLLGKIQLGLPPRQPSPPHDMQYWHTCLSLVYTALSLSDSDDEKIQNCILQLQCGIREEMLSVCNRFIQSVQHRYPLPPVDIVTALDLTLEDVRTITYDFTPEKVRELLPRFEWYNQHLFCEYVAEQYMRSGASEAKIKAFCQIIYDGVQCPSAIWDDEEPSPANIPCTTAEEALKKVAISNEMKKTDGTIQTSLWLAVYKCYIKYVEYITVKDFSELLRDLGITQKNVATNLSKGEKLIKSFDSDPQKWTYTTDAAKNKYVAVAKLFLAMIDKEK